MVQFLVGQADLKRLIGNLDRNASSSSKSPDRAASEGLWRNVPDSRPAVRPREPAVRAQWHGVLMDHAAIIYPGFCEEMFAIDVGQDRWLDEARPPMFVAWSPPYAIVAHSSTNRST